MDPGKEEREVRGDIGPMLHVILWIAFLPLLPGITCCIGEEIPGVPKGPSEFSDGPLLPLP